MADPRYTDAGYGQLTTGIDRTKDPKPAKDLATKFITTVVDARPGVTTVQFNDGTIAEREGNRNVRNNNPGNIEYGSFAKSLGAVGTDGRFAVFPTEQQGMKAQEALLFDGAGYKNKTLAQAVARWAPPSENDTAKYQNVLLAAVGGKNAPMSEYNAQERAALLQAMRKHEGYTGKSNDTQINTSPAGYVSRVVGSNTGGVANPLNQTGAVQGYNNQMLDAAQKIANNNLASVNNFGWNPTIVDSSAQKFGKSVQGVTDAQTAIANKQVAALSRYNPDGTKKSFGEYAYDHILGARSENINSRALAKIQAEQLGTGDAMAKQVADMKATMAGTVVAPEFFDKAAGNLTSQQQAENGTFNAVTNNANQQAQLKQQLDIATMQNDTEKAKVEAAQQKANGIVGNPDDSSLINAARSLGIQLPEGMKTSDIKATLGDKLAAVQAVAANNGSLGNDPYTAVQIVNQMGSAAPAELVKQAMQHSAFQQQIISKIPATEFKPVDSTLDKNTIAANTAYNDNVKRVNINKAYAEAAAGNLDLPNNPYTATGNVKTLSNGIPLPKGIEPDDVGKLSAAQFINKAVSEGSSAVEIANFYKQLTSARTSTTQYKTFNAPEPTGNFLVKIKGIDAKINLATPAGIEQLQALNKTYGVTNTGAISSKFMQIFSGSFNDAQGTVPLRQYETVRESLNSPLK